MEYDSMGRKIKDNKVNTDKLKGQMISSKLLLLFVKFDIYSGLPIILFLVNWFDWYIGIPVFILFALYGFAFEDDSFLWSLIDLLAASVICFIFDILRTGRPRSSFSHGTIILKCHLQRPYWAWLACSAWRNRQRSCLLFHVLACACL